MKKAALTVLGPAVVYTAVGMMITVGLLAVVFVVLALQGSRRGVARR